jgi:hypothetical protein
MDAYAPRTRKRIAKLLEERDGLRKQIGPLEGQARATVELQNFLKQADIAREDFGLVLDLAAAMRRGDFRAFLEGVTPYVKLAQESLGIQLPQDLQQAVQGGHMTADAARYVAQERSARLLAETRLNRTTQEASQRTHAERVQAFQNEVAGAVTVWEQTVQRSDPDYARKQPLVQNLLHAVVQERGPPRSPAEAVEIARQAYDRANQLAGTFVPRPQATRQVPSSIANRLNGARPEPRNLKEVIHYALERGRGA